MVVKDKFKEFKNNLTIINENIDLLLENIKKIKTKELERIITSDTSYLFNLDRNNNSIVFHNNDFGIRIPLDRIFKLDAINYQNWSETKIVTPNWSVTDGEIIPNEDFEWEWSEEMLDKYLDFCEILLLQLNRLNSDIENSSKGKMLEELRKKYFQ